jgi:hypothetical protein
MRDFQVLYQPEKGLLKMCECCTPKEHLGHFHLHDMGGKDLDGLNDVLRRLPGVFNAQQDDHGDAVAVVLFDTRIIAEETLRSALNAQGFQA